VAATAECSGHPVIAARQPAEPRRVLGQQRSRASRRRTGRFPLVLSRALGTRSLLAPEVGEQAGAEAAPGVTDKDERAGLEQPEHARLIGCAAEARFAQGVASVHPRELAPPSCGVLIL